MRLSTFSILLAFASLSGCAGTPWYLGHGFQNEAQLNQRESIPKLQDLVRNPGDDSLNAAMHLAYHDAEAIAPVQGRLLHQLAWRACWNPYSPSQCDAFKRAVRTVGPSSVPTLQDLLPDGDTSLAAAIGLVMLGPQAEPATPALVTALGSPSNLIRINAAEALRVIGKSNPEILAVLRRVATEDEDETVRDAGARAYRALAPPGAEPLSTGSSGAVAPASSPAPAAAAPGVPAPSDEERNAQQQCLAGEDAACLRAKELRTKRTQAAPAP